MNLSPSSESKSATRDNWFYDARFGMFIHWGPYALYGRGEQVLFREYLDHQDYARRACAWNPQHADPAHWAKVAREAGMRYAVLTTRHHDGFCLWNSAYTDYSTAMQASGRDFVREYVEAFRAADLRVGLYYSLADWRIPAYWDGPERDPHGWQYFVDYVHNQVCELLSNYGRIDTLWFDSPWPHSAATWQSVELLEKIYSLQPNILVNNRLDSPKSLTLGDFSTPEHEITADPDRLWESCQTSVRRLWGHAVGERWRSTDVLLDMLVESASQGGNLLLNVGPDAEGRLPQPFVDRMRKIGQWLEIHGEAVYGCDGGDVCEFVTYGWQTIKENRLYLIIRFWDKSGEVSLAGLKTHVVAATFLTTGEALKFEQTADHLKITGLPVEPPTDLYPVIRLECEARPQAQPWAVDRLWQGDPSRFTAWARARGESVWMDGRPWKAD